MSIQVFHLPLDWRRAKFYLCHPATTPDLCEPFAIVSLSCSYFLPSEQIDNVILIRNWLHGAALLGRYHLFGCHERLTNLFKGIVFVFDHTCDLLRFHEYCQAAW